MRNNIKKRRATGSIKLQPYNYLIVCEGTKTEPYYFQGLKVAMNKKYGDKVTVLPKITIKGVGENTESLVKFTEKYINLSNKIYGKVWILFDKDNFSDRKFDNAVLNSQYNIAWSNPSFELYILSHFKYISKNIDNKEVYRQLNKEFKLKKMGKYSKNDKDIFLKLSKFCDLSLAIDNCRKMDNLTKHIKSPAERNPTTMVYKLIEELTPYI